jgi:hypothetical protein
MTGVPTNGGEGGGGDAYRALAAELERAKTRASQAEIALKDVHGSTSWKLTAPLRALLAWLRRVDVSGAPELNHATLEAPPGFPSELQRLDPPLASSDASARIVDGRPLLAALLPPGFEEAADASGTQAWLYAGVRPSAPTVAVWGSVELARELALCAHVALLDDASWMLRLHEVVPDLVLLAPDARYSLTNGGDWVGHMANFCNERGVPIALWIWNDEDGLALKLAEHASAIFVLCETARQSVKKILPNKPIFVLPLGVAPELYNPIRTPGLQRLSERTAGVRMSDTLSGMLEDFATVQADAALLACESYWDLPASRVAGAMSGVENVLGVLRPEDKVALWKAGIGEQLTKDSRKPAWWTTQQILRMAACGVHANRNEKASSGADADVLTHVDPTVGTRAEVAGLSALTTAHRAMRKAIGASMLSRLEAMAGHLGRETPRKRHDTVSCLLVSKRPALARIAVESMLAQAYSSLEVILVLHGVSGEVASGIRYALPDRVRVLAEPEHRSLGYCLNMAFEASSGSYWLKIDDDDIYGPCYVQDMMLHARSIDYDLIGKPLVFTLFEQDDALFLDAGMLEFANTLHRGSWPKGVVCGATLGGRREVLEHQPFPSSRRHGVDSLFLDECSRRDMSLLVADPFNFTCTRNESERSHTWVGNERVIRSRGVRLGGRASIGEVVNL